MANAEIQYPRRAAHTRLAPEFLFFKAPREGMEQRAKVQLNMRGAAARFWPCPPRYFDPRLLVDGAKVELRSHRRMAP